jgi:hypothetical protein
MRISRTRALPLVKVLCVNLLVFLLVSSAAHLPLAAQEISAPTTVAERSFPLTGPLSNTERVTAATAFLTVGFFWLFRARAKLQLWTAIHLGLILALTAALMIGWGDSSPVPSNPGGTKSSPQNHDRTITPEAGSETQSAKSSLRVP